MAVTIGCVVMVHLCIKCLDWIYKRRRNKLLEHSELNQISSRSDIYPVNEPNLTPKKHFPSELCSKIIKIFCKKRNEKDDDKSPTNKNKKLNKKPSLLEAGVLNMFVGYKPRITLRKI